jgi:dTDP-4-dehydrorhamnose reductase
VRVVVTGHEGQVVRSLVERGGPAGATVIPLGRPDLDLAGPSERIVDAIKATAPEVIVSAAAYTSVDKAESEREIAFAVNEHGPRAVAGAARELGVPIIHLSTDYVFDGEKGGFYTQRDDPNPISEYGRAKLEGERLAQQALARSIIVRSGWIFGPHGTNFLSRVVYRMLEGEEVTAISDAFGTPTYAVDLAARLRELAILDVPGIYHVVNAGEGTSFAGFAIAASEGKTPVREMSASDISRPAPRPNNSRLSCVLSEALGLAPLRGWEPALAEYIETVRSQAAAPTS